MRNFILLIFYIFIFSTAITQQRLSDFQGDGTTSIHKVHEHNGVAYHIVASNCNEISVNRLINSNEEELVITKELTSVFRESLTISENLIVFGSSEGIVVFDFIADQVFIGEFMSGYRFLSTFQVVGKTVYFSALDSLGDFRSGYYVIGDKMEFLDKGSRFEIYEREHFVQSEETEDEYHYYNTHIPSGERHHIISKRRTVSMLSENGIVYYFGEFFLLEGYNLITNEVIKYNQIAAFPSNTTEMDIDNGQIVIGGESGDNYLLEVYRLEDSLLIGEYEFEGSHGSPVRIQNLTIREELVMGSHPFSSFLFMYNISSGTEERINGFETTFSLGDGKSLVIANNMLTAVSHDDFSLQQLEGEFNIDDAHSTSFVNLGNQQFILVREIDNLIEFTHLNLDTYTHELLTGFTTQNFGFALSSSLDSYQGQPLVLSSDGLVVIDSDSTSIIIPGEDIRLIQRSEELIVLIRNGQEIWIYDGNPTKIFDINDHDEFTNVSFSTLDIAYFPSSLLIRNELELYFFDFSSSVLSKVADIDEPSIRKFGDWVYYVEKEKGLMRISEFQDSQEIAVSVDRIRDYLTYFKEKTLLINESTLYSLSENGNVETEYVGTSNLFFSNSSPDNGHLFLTDNNSGVHYDGIDFYPLPGRIFDPLSEYVTIADRESIYLMSQKILLPFPNGIDSRIIGHLRTGNQDLLITEPGQWPHNIYKIYQVDSSFASAELIFEREEIISNSSFSSARIDDVIIFNLGGAFFTIKDNIIDEIPDLSSRRPFFHQLDNEVFFMSISKAGNQVFSWSPLRSSSTQSIPNKEFYILYPNPTPNVLTITPTPKNWRLYNNQMKKLDEGVGSTLNTSHLIDGVYFLVLLDERGEWQVQKFIKSKNP